MVPSDFGKVVQRHNNLLRRDRQDHVQYAGGEDWVSRGYGVRAGFRSVRGRVGKLVLGIALVVGQAILCAPLGEAAEPNIWINYPLSVAKDAIASSGATCTHTADALPSATPAPGVMMVASNHSSNCRMNLYLTGWNSIPYESYVMFTAYFTDSQPCAYLESRPAVGNNWAFISYSNTKNSAVCPGIANVSNDAGAGYVNSVTWILQNLGDTVPGGPALSASIGWLNMLVRGPSGDYPLQTEVHFNAYVISLSDPAALQQNGQLGEIDGKLQGLQDGQQENTEAINNVNNTLNSSSTPDAGSTVDRIEDSSSSQVEVPGTISGVMSSLVGFFNPGTWTTCTPLALPEIKGINFTIPCSASVPIPSAIRTVVGSLLGGLVGIPIILMLYNITISLIRGRPEDALKEARHAYRSGMNTFSAGDSE